MEFFPFFPVAEIGSYVIFYTKLILLPVCEESEESKVYIFLVSLLQTTGKHPVHVN